MAADDCIPQLQACRVRVCDLDADGAPLGDAGSLYVSDAFVRITLTPVYKDGQEIQEDNACGTSFIDYKSDDSFTRADIEIDLITPDPDLHAVLINNSVVLTAGGGGKGWQFPPVGEIGGNGVSIEWWTKRIVSGALSQVHPYAQWAAPRVRSLKLGPREFSNTAQHALISGQCNENDNWGDGPGNDFDADSSKVAQWIPVDELPDTTCGAPGAAIAS